MTKKQFIKLLVVGNILLVGLVVFAFAGGWFFFNKLPSISNQVVTNLNKSNSDSLVLGLSTFDTPVLLFQQNDNNVKILIYKSAINYQEIFQLELANTALPVQSQLINLDNEHIAYVVNDFNTQTVRKYSFSGEATDIYRTSAEIRGIMYYSNYLYILINANDNYKLIRSDLQGQELEIASFTSKENFYLNFLNSEFVEFKNVNTAACAKIVWTGTDLVAEEKCTDATTSAQTGFNQKYQIFNRYQTSSGEYLPESSPLTITSTGDPNSYPVSYPNSYPKLILKQYVYSKDVVQKVLNMYTPADEAALNQFLIGQSYVFESQLDFNLTPIFSSDQVNLLLESGLSSNDKNLIAIYPDSKTERMRLSVMSNVDYLGATKDQSEIFLVSRAVMNGLERDSIISFGVKTRNLQEYALPQCQPSVINCTAGLLLKP